MSEKYYSKLAANLILTRINNGKKEILLQLRKNKDYMNNMYDTACGGHVEYGESFIKTIIREAKEEIGIEIKKEALKFLCVFDSYKTDHVLLFFTTKSFKGTPIVCEPNKCGGLLWTSIDNLPENTVPYLKNIIEGINQGIQYFDNDSVD